jgi:hypothetical protein
MIGSHEMRTQANGANAAAIDPRLAATAYQGRLLGERFHLEGIAEGFNALNHRNNEIPMGPSEPAFIPAILTAVRSADGGWESQTGAVRAPAHVLNAE